MVRYRQELLFGHYADPTQSQRSTSSPLCSRRRCNALENAAAASPADVHAERSDALSPATPAAIG